MNEPGQAFPLTGARIAHVGRQPEYTRDRIVAKALRRAGAEVVTVTGHGRFPQRWAGSARAVRRGRFDALLVSTLSQADVPFTRALGLATRTPVVFDASIALYETMVESRGTVRAGSVRAGVLALEDLLACRLASMVLIDTDAHLSYLRRRSGAPASRFHCVWLGADDDLLYPRPAAPAGTSRFRVLFYASYSPLHGAEHIVRAAAQVARVKSDVEFLMVGSGPEDDRVRALASELGVDSIRFSSRVPYDELPALIASSDVCLGVFGAIGPAARVIPFKVFDGLAMARAVVTADTPAAREALVDGVHCRLCPPGDPSALARTLIELEEDRAGRDAMAARGHQLFLERFSIDALSADLATAFTRVLGG